MDDLHESLRIMNWKARKAMKPLFEKLMVRLRPFGIRGEMRWLADRERGEMFFQMGRGRKNGYRLVRSSWPTPRSECPMLSPGDFFRTVPRGKLPNARFRQRVLTEAGRSRSLQADLREACKRDILFYVNVFGWTFDPRLKASKSIPFTTYPFQDKALLAILSAIEDGADLVIQKSRDMGASWMSLVVMEPPHLPAEAALREPRVRRDHRRRGDDREGVHRRPAVGDLH